MAYNPYKAVKSIAEQKDGWYKANKSGQDTKQYQQAALPYYKELYDNGFGHYADALQGSNNIHAWELMSEWGLKPDEQFAVDEAYNNVTGTGNGAAGGANANQPAYGADPSTQKLLDMSMGAGQDQQDFLNRTMGIGTGQVSTQPSETVDAMLNAWQGGNERLNGAIQYDQNGNVISGLNTEHYNIGRNQLDYLNNFDVTKQPYYEGIMAQYKLGGANAANNAYAQGAANNGGNIDSYAAANANRQQLAFTTAGQQAALQAAQQNQAAWQTLYSQMSQDLNNQGVLNANTLQQAAQMYQVDANERMNALDVAGALEQQAMANAIQGYLGNIQADMQKYGIDAETAMNRENNKAAYERLMATLASNKDIQMLVNDLGYYQTDANERMNTSNNQTQLGVADIQGQTQRDVAGIQGQTQLGVAGINRDATLGSAQIGANATITTAELQNQLNKYLGDLGYNQAIAGYQNAYDIASMGNQSELSRTKLNNQNALTTAYLNNGDVMDENGNWVKPDVLNLIGAGDGTGAGSTESIQTAVNRAAQIFSMYMNKSDPSLGNPTDMYMAIRQIYPDTTSKEYTEAVAYIDKMLKTNKDYGVGIMSFNIGG